jgi:NAD(P)-dependent dehydrogenase (short-subunit alcohol dehydrogenase family)
VSGVAIVTGAARGIGAATAARFVEGGYEVVGADVLESEEDAPYRVHSCDVADEAAVAALVGRALDEHGRIDVLANVAGIALVKPLYETTWEEYRRVVDVNLGGTFLLCKHVLPAMRAQRSGAIVNMASVSGHVGQTDHALYGATKGAILSFCRALAWEVALWGIRVNSVSPGSVDTPMLRGDVETEAKRYGRAYDVVKREREAEQALGRWAQPREIAEAVYFLAGGGASFITGADLLVDAGWVAK